MKRVLICLCAAAFIMSVAANSQASGIFEEDVVDFGSAELGETNIMIQRILVDVEGGIFYLDDLEIIDTDYDQFNVDLSAPATYGYGSHAFNCYFFPETEGTKTVDVYFSGRMQVGDDVVDSWFLERAFRLEGTGYLSPPVPIPGAIWLLGSGLIGIVGIRKKFKK